MTEDESDITFIKETLVPFGKNLFWDSIPYEWTHTYETQPQTLVTVGETHAACHTLKCHFMYFEAVGLITSFTYDEETYTLTIFGTDLPEWSMIERIEFGDELCRYMPKDWVKEGEIKCRLRERHVCGHWKPRVFSRYGRVPIA